ncbi:MAG TPA: BamA/TamA family outer membrane protein [Vicinamibacterales bacterium]|nr:BamA/TamA family outer membrane protein [Vicinamibacterales bacterium]
MSIRAAAAAVCVCLLASPARGQTPQVPPGRFTELVTNGVSVFSPTEVRWTLRLEAGAPLPETPENLAKQLQQRYEREGYAKARVSATYDEASGRLRLDADEGRIDAIAFEGVDQALAAELRDAFGVGSGDPYNTRQISRALRDLLRPARGALRLLYDMRPEPGTVFHDSSELRSRGPGRPFDLVDRDGRRTLVVHVRRARGDFDATLGTDSREDWYSPVDGLNLALGFGGAIFDQRRFNHTYLQGYVSYKFARDRAGYSFDVERAVLGGPDAPRLLLSAGLHDTTSSDDFWRLSVTEQSLVSLAFKNSFRDYYEERGYQLGAAFQPNAWHELRASWRADRHEGLANESDYSLFRDDEIFRPNAGAADGRLRALVFGYTVDTRGVDEESGRATLRRHAGPSLFGSFGGTDPGARVEWSSEIARPAFGGDFDFTRHIANARAYVSLTPAQRLHGRLLLGTSSGTLPPQRLFALGGIGTVHGYSFKEAAGERLVLVNLEYQLGGDRGPRAIAFFDAGRVYRPVNSSGDWLTGVGVGLAIGDLRLDLGWRAEDIPKSFQAIVRFGPTF